MYESEAKVRSITTLGNTRLFLWGKHESMGGKLVIILLFDVLDGIFPCNNNMLIILQSVFDLLALNTN